MPKCLFKKGNQVSRGYKNGSWKGDKVKYSGLHKWVRENLGTADHCEKCGLKEVPKGITKYGKQRTRYFQWANISHKYKRDLTDYKQMCIPCHKLYDLPTNKIPI